MLGPLNSVLLLLIAITLAVAVQTEIRYGLRAREPSKTALKQQLDRKSVARSLSVRVKSTMWAAFDGSSSHISAFQV